MDFKIGDKVKFKKSLMSGALRQRQGQQQIGTVTKGNYIVDKHT